MNTDARSGLRNMRVGLQVNFLVLQAPPEPLHEDVVHEAALPILNDLDAVLFQQPRERLAGELRAMVPGGRTLA